MSINYDKYINSTSTHYISNSGRDECGKYNSGAAGDQTGKEWQLAHCASQLRKHNKKEENFVLFLFFMAFSTLSLTCFLESLHF